MIDNEIINSLKKQISKWDQLLKDPKIEEWKSRKATNITLLNNIFWKNNEYSNVFQKMVYSFFLSWDWIPDRSEIKRYNEYINTWKSILSSALDIYKTWISFTPQKNSKSNSKKSQTINVNNNNIINQTQTINIDIENSLKNELTVKQYEKLDEILQNKNKKTKWEKIKEFLLQLWSETLAKILKDILLWN